MGMEATDPRAKNNSALNAARSPSNKQRDTVADWLMLYAQTYREEITPELVLLYQNALQHIPARLLHRAFLAAAKAYKFRPTPAEVITQAEILADRDPKQLPGSTCEHCEPDGWRMENGKALRCNHNL